MIKKNSVNLLRPILVLSLFLTGCSSFDGPSVRREHAEDYQQDLSEKTEKLLSDSHHLNLDDCIQIALQNNLGIRTSKIQERIAKLGKQVAFSHFIPSVDLNYNYTRWHPQPQINIESRSTALHDARVRNLTWAINMSIFEPSTWFLYSMHQRGEEIAGLISEYVKQMTILQITVLYYNCLMLHEIDNALESQLKTVTTLEQTAELFRKEGLISQWQLDKAGVLVLQRETTRHRTRYALTQAKSDLSRAMGLSPLAEIFLDQENPLKVLENSLEELILESLLSHPQLQIADREVAIEEEKVKVAIAAFLPKLILFAGHTNTSDSFQLFSNIWSGGLTGTVAIFNGFANINEYKAAKQRKEDVFIQREEKTLAVIIEVIRAQFSLTNSQEEMLLARKNFDMESRRLMEVEQHWQEGFVETVKMLSAVADRDQAQMELMNSKFKLQVSIATLLNAVGLTNTEIKESEHDG